MENKMNYTKATLLLVAGILALAISFWLGEENGAYGFFIGFGYAALAGGVLGLLMVALKRRAERSEK
ncbi:hypothetical protein [Pontibacter ramchanderi]|uniref:Uncharacterized protein n=1 Tax=Pontibacter ramchanderi TaxID=1179743 RepID=A0A2N3U9U3_9BACT|nr:hypothetical protein [Pontibacter ramchanderi]PKV63549.1 hypothetical protein BD749_3393 [Pontibacter ramchanderi]